MKPQHFAPWAEQTIGQSAAVARVESGGVGRGDEAMPCSTRFTFATGAQVHIGWVCTSPPTGGGAVGEPDAVVTGPIPEPVKVPELRTSGRLRTADIEQHLAALINNGGHEQVQMVRGYTADPKLGSDSQPYGLRIDFHDASTVYGLFIHTLSSGQQPGKPYDQREEV